MRKSKAKTGMLSAQQLEILLNATSHDTKTALTVITGNSAELQKHLSNGADQLESMLNKETADEACFLHRTINDLLLLFRINNGLVALTLAEIDLAEMVTSVLSRVDGKPISMRIEKSCAQCRSSVLGDRLLLDRAIDALLSAALSSWNGCNEFPSIRIGGSDVAVSLTLGCKAALPLPAIHGRFKEADSNKTHADGSRGLVVRFTNNVVVTLFLFPTQRKLLKNAATHVLANPACLVE